MKELIDALPPAAQPTGRWWPLEIAGDAMAPTLNRGEVALVVPCHAYEGHAIYVFAESAETVIYRVEGDKRMLDNERYWVERASRIVDRCDADWFAVHVVGRVVGVIAPMQ